MILNLEIRNTENIQNVGQDHIKQIEKIVTALVSSGGLTGVKGGKTIIHFDPSGRFMGIELDYWPWRLREQDR